MTCHPERKGPQTLFSSGVPKERSLLFGVEVGGGESKDLLLHFGIYATKFGDRTRALAWFLLQLTSLSKGSEFKTVACNL